MNRPSTPSYFKILLVIAAWLLIIIVTYTTRDHHALFYILGHRIGITIAILTSLIVFILDRINYKLVRRITAFLATITAGICMLAWLILLRTLKQRDNTPSLLLAHSAGKFGDTLDIRKNNTFKLTSHQRFETNYIRGSYELKDSLLILDYAAARKELETNRFVIRTVLSIDSIAGGDRPGIWDADTATRTYLIPIDDQGAYMETARKFRVGWRTTF